MALPTCSLTGCQLIPPALPASNCAPAVEDGEITDIFITDTAISAVADLANYDNAGGAGNVIRLKVTGSLTEPEQGETRVEGGNTIFNPRKNRSVTFEVYDQSDETYNAVRQFECGKSSIVYYKMGSHVFGGSANFVDGISTVLRINQVSDGADSLARFVGQFSWADQYAPIREVSPTLS
jgi:hypothetical protein